MKKRSFVLGGGVGALLVALSLAGCSKDAGPGVATAAPSASTPASASPGASGSGTAGAAGPARGDKGKEVGSVGTGESPGGSAVVQGSAAPEPKTPPAEGSAGPATPSPAPSFAAGPYKDGDVLAVMPPNCTGRVYLNVGALTADLDPASLRGAIAKLAVAENSAGGDAEKITKLLEDGFKVLADGGVDIAKLREVAACVAEKNRDMVIAAGADLSAAKDPLATLSKALVALKGRGKEKPIVERGGIRFIDMGDPIAQPAANVIAFLEDDDALPLLKGGGAAGFAEAQKHLVFVDVKEDVDEHVSLSVDAAGSDLDFRLRMLPDGRQGRAFKDKPDEALREVNAVVAQIAGRLAGTSLAPVGDAMKRVKLSVEQGELVAALMLPKGDLATLIKAVAGAKLEDFAKAMGEGGGPGRKYEEPSSPKPR